MIIIRNGHRLSLPDTFLDENYIFGAVRFRRIKEMSGLSYLEFAKAYGFSYGTMMAWAGYRKKGKNNNPVPHIRVRLAEIEASLIQKKKKKKAP
jgi:hypothetical protein